MRVITTRVDEKDEQDLREIEREEKSDRSEIVRKLLSKSIKDWRLRFALEKLKRREVSIKKAAEIARISFSDMLDLMAKENIDTGYSLDDLEKDISKMKLK